MEPEALCLRLSVVSACVRAEAFRADLLSASIINFILNDPEQAVMLNYTEIVVTARHGSWPTCGKLGRD